MKLNDNSQINSIGSTWYPIISTSVIIPKFIPVFAFPSWLFNVNNLLFVLYLEMEFWGPRNQENSFYYNATQNTFHRLLSVLKVCYWFATG